MRDIQQQLEVLDERVQRMDNRLDRLHERLEGVTRKRIKEDRDEEDQQIRSRTDRS